MHLDKRNRTVHTTIADADIEVLKRGCVRAHIDGELKAIGRITESVIAGGKTSVALKIVDRNAWAALENGEFTTVRCGVDAVHLIGPRGTVERLTGLAGDLQKMMPHLPSAELQKLAADAEAHAERVAAPLRAQVAAIIKFFDEPMPCPWTYVPQAVAKKSEDEQTRERLNQSFIRRGQ